ncbi:recombinase zinc beta ribbon domain-containing protein [Streptodolium elevatio]|uniref:Recombinase family protein n=1 Tax=Streptodolium elevatio TaxID=3157996 RepID=A0ABV3DAB4_9ACTN
MARLPLSQGGTPTGGKTGTSVRGDKGRVVERYSWTGATITGILRSPALLGWKTHKGQVVRDALGAPVMFTDTPLLTREEFDAINALLDERAIPERRTIRRDSTAQLRRVIECEGCGHRMYLTRANGRRTTNLYYCNPSARGGFCPSVASVRAEWAEEYVEREFLRLVGHIPYHRVTVIPGYDPAAEIAATLAEYEEHQNQRGRQKSQTARDAWQRQADALDNRLAELESTLSRPERRDVIPTGRTYADDWYAADSDGKREMLIEAGARLIVRKGPSKPTELDESLVTFILNGELHPILDEAGALTHAETNAAAPTVPGTRLRLDTAGNRTTSVGVSVAA